MRPQVSVPVEPLAPLGELSRYLIRVTPRVDDRYLTYCHRLVGATICDTSCGERSVVVSFDVLQSDLPLPVHTVRREPGGETQRVLLGLRDYLVASPSTAVISHIDLRVALSKLHAVGGTEAFPGLLDDIASLVRGDPLPSVSPPAPAIADPVSVAGGDAPDDAQAAAETGPEQDTGDAADSSAAPAVSPLEAARANEAVQQVMQQATRLARLGPDALSIVSEERGRVSTSPVESDVGGAGGEMPVDPTMRVHTVMIAVSDEIPFELFWPMVRDDIMGAVRELCQRGIPQMEEAVQAGVAQNGMGPVAQRLTLEEAEMLAARVGHVVQTAVTVDAQAVQELQRERAKGNQTEVMPIGSRVQFSPKTGDNWTPGVIVGHCGAVPGKGSRGEKFDIIDDNGLLWERLPRSRVRTPPGRRETPSSMGTPIHQAVLSQADLVRIREHLRRRQEEWAERHAQMGPSAPGGSGARGDGASVAERLGSSRPTSAPAIAQRQRASVDASSALEMVQFIEEGIGDEEFDDDGDGPRDPGDDGEEDDEDLPPLEPSEAGDSQTEAMPPPRLSGARSGEPRDGEEELRVLEQLRAMEQIISEVLDPQDGQGRPRRDPGHAEDFLTAPMANLRIRMGGGADGRVETYHIRRTSSRSSDRPGGFSMEALRGEFPAFTRAADIPNPTSSLDHPVVARLGAADLVEEEDASVDDPMEPPIEGERPLLPHVRFSLQAPQSEEEKSSATFQPSCAPLSLPPSWNLLKAMQFLNDQRLVHGHSDEGGEAATPARLPFGVQALQKVPLDNWSLCYVLDATDQDATSDLADKCAQANAPMEVDATGPRTSPRLSAGFGSGLPAKKRRRMQAGHQGREAATDDVAREIYSSFTAEASPGASPHELIARCGDNIAVTEAIELLHLLNALGSSSYVEPNLWVSSKLDRKLRYQLEDPLSVVSGTLPFWATTLPRVCPFLFSLKTRKMLLKYTAFGPSFAVHWTRESKVGSFLRRRVTVQTELNAQTDPRKIQELSQELSNIEEHVVKSNFWLGTLQSTLVRFQKGDKFLQQSDVAMELISASSNLVEVQFDGETGFGSAVTQSFYVEVAQILQDREKNRSLPMWVEDDTSGNSQYLLCRRGLMIRPLPDGPQREDAVRRFRFLGRFMGQALREGFIAPLPLAEEFFALVVGEKLGAESLPRPGSGTAGEFVGVLADFAAELTSGQESALPGGSSEELYAWRAEQAERPDFAERFLSHSHAEGAPTQAMSFSQYVSLVGASFLETGLSGAPLVPGGENIAVTVENLHEFVEQASRFWFDSGVSSQVEAFRAGLNDVFPFECLVAFSPVELREMFCGEDRIDWDEQALLAHLHPSGGLTEKSPTYKFLVAELVEMSQASRSRFLDFVSSCPRLPPGGISKFHVDVFPDASATKQGFPRSRACANQLYLPPYTSKEELHQKLHEAIHCSAGHHEQRVRDH